MSGAVQQLDPVTSGLLAIARAQSTVTDPTVRTVAALSQPSYLTQHHADVATHLIRTRSGYEFDPGMVIGTRFDAYA